MDANRHSAIVDAVAATLDLPIAPAHRPGVLMYFGIAADLAALVMSMPLEVHDDAAAAFVPIGPDDAALVTESAPAMPRTPGEPA